MIILMNYVMRLCRMQSYKIIIRNLCISKKLLLTDYPLINKIELAQAVTIRDEDLKSLKEYHEINNSIKNALMKEAYFRGIKDTILILARANIMESQ